MNIVPLIQEKWSLIGTRLNISSDKLDNFWQMAGEQQIPTESKNTFCCVKMLTSWYETSDNVSTDAVVMAIDAPHVGLKIKMSSIETALTSEYAIEDGSAGKTATNPPQKFEQSYLDMITRCCSELSTSRCTLSDILTYLKVCNINSEVVKEVTDFPELLRSLERYQLLNKTDLSWLKNIAQHAQCMKATKIIEDYERFLMADKIPWYRSHSKGTYLVGRTNKSPENVTIEESSSAKLAASKVVNVKELDTILDSSEVGSVTFYWKFVNADVVIKIPKVVHTSLVQDCKIAGLTHIGIMNDGDLSLANVDLIGEYTSVQTLRNCIDIKNYIVPTFSVICMYSG